MHPHTTDPGRLRTTQLDDGRALAWAAWSAHAVTVIMLIYAVAKVVHALDGRLAAGAVAIVGALVAAEPLRWTQIPASVLAVVATGCWAVMTRATVATRRRVGEHDGS